MKSEMSNSNYADVRAVLKDSIRGMQAAQIAAGRVNLYPTMTPADVRRQIDGVEEMLSAALRDLSEARQACAATGRRTIAEVQGVLRTN